MAGNPGRHGLRNFVFAAVAALIASAAAAQAADPYQWLEEINGAKPLAQVKAWNAETEADLTKVPGYEEHRQRALAILNNPKQIAMPDEVMGDMVANHWVDADHKRGLWRISPLQPYLAGKPQWRTLIDVDALGAKEGKSWVWHGADCLAPDYQRCLVSLSPGGTDADIVREYDIGTGQFVAGGFVVPEAKSTSSWVDRDHLLVATDWGAVPLSVWSAIVYSGIGALVVGNLIWYHGVSKIGPTRVSMFSNLQPLVALAVAWIALGEVPTIWQGLGAGSIMTGLIITRT